MLASGRSVPAAAATRAVVRKKAAPFLGSRPLSSNARISREGAPGAAQANPEPSGGAGGASGTGTASPRRGGGVGQGALVAVVAVGAGTAAAITLAPDRVPSEVFDTLRRVGLKIKTPPLSDGRPRREAWDFNEAFNVIGMGKSTVTKSTLPKKAPVIPRGIPGERAPPAPGTSAPEAAVAPPETKTAVESAPSEEATEAEPDAVAEPSPSVSPEDAVGSAAKVPGAVAPVPGEEAVVPGTVTGKPSDVEEAAGEAAGEVAGAGSGGGVDEETPVTVAEAIEVDVGELVAKAQRIRDETLSSVVEKTEAVSSSLRREIDRGVLKDIKELDEDGLRFRLAQLVVEMQERTKWEALRLMEGVKRAEEEVARKYEKLLKEQKDVLEMEASRAMHDQEAKLLEEVTRQYSEQLREQLQQQASNFSEALHQKVVAGNDALREELAAEHAKEISAVRAEAAADAEARIAELQYLREQTERIAEALEATREAEKVSEEVHKVAYAALALAESFATSKPVKAELENLRRLAGGDELLQAAVAAIPEKAASKGIPTLDQLRNRFGFVKGECRRAALVPPQAGDGLGGQIMAAILAKITFAPKGMVEGDSPEDLLARAACLLEAGELKSAVGELEKLEGLPAETVRDWLSDAKSRLTADEALRVIRCQASLLAANHLGSKA